MDLIERYLYQVGRYLPLKKREDILTELRSNLLDALGVSEGEEVDEERVVALLEEFGPPQKVAASYHTGMNCLIGPELFPLFRMVTGIALIAVFGALVLALAVGAVFDPEIAPWSSPQTILETLSGMWNALISTFGMVVLVFTILQYFGVRAEQAEKWQPRRLPPVTRSGEQVNRLGIGIEVALDILLLVLLWIFVDKGGVLARLDHVVITNQVIQAYVPLISVVLVVSILFHAFTLYYARWTPVMRLLKVGVSLVSIYTLYVLVSGHIAWLSAHGSSSFLTTLESLELLPQASETIVQNVTMQAFRLGFTIALVVESIETAVEIVRLGFQAVTRSGASPAIGLEG